MTDKIPLLLIPGLACNHIMWQRQLESLSDIADCQIAPLPAYDDFGPIAEAILAAAPDRFAMAGASMGGYLCFEVLRRAPDRVLRLGLIGTSADPEPPDMTERRLVMIDKAERNGLLVMWRNFIPRLVHPDRLNEGAVVDDLLQQAFEVGLECFCRHQRALMKRSGYLDMLSAISCPTIVIMGRDDQVTPLPVHERMVNGIPGAEFVIIEDSGHVPMMERPDATTTAMRSWLTDG